MSGETQTRAMTTVLQRRRAAAAAAATAASRPSAPAGAPRKSRARTAAVAAFTALTLAGGAVGWFGAMSCRSSIRRQTEETEALRREIADMRAVIAGRDETARAAGETMREHAALKGALLEPLLDSYAMRAKTLLEAEADAAALSGVQFDDVVPHALMPPVTPASKSPYVLRGVRVTAFGSYQRLATFVCRVERLFPAVLVDSVTISSDLGRDVAHQRGEFVFCWLSARDGEVAK